MEQDLILIGAGGCMRELLWQIEELNNGEVQFVNKIKKNFGGNLIKLKNNCTVFFVRNVEFYEKEDFENINLIDDLNFKKIKSIKTIL